MVLRASNGASTARLLACTSQLAASRPLLKFNSPRATAYYSARFVSTSRGQSRSVRYNPPASSPQAPASSSLNPPRSTLPPALALPIRQPEQSTPSYYFNLGKAYARFYKDGVKAVWNNGKAASAVRRSKLGGVSSPMEAAQKGLITRGEWHLLRRSSADRRKIPMFALLFAICGEFTPLVVVFASPLVPWTCRIPKQVQVERRNRHERRRLSFHDTGEERLRQGGEAAEWRLEALKREEVLHIGRCLALYGKTWDLLGGFPVSALRRRVEKRMSYLKADDQLIREGGGAGALNSEEAAVACEERGLDVLNGEGKDKSPAELKQQLENWLKKTEKTPMTRLLLVQQKNSQ